MCERLARLDMAKCCGRSIRKARTFFTAVFGRRFAIVLLHLFEDQAGELLAMCKRDVLDIVFVRQVRPQVIDHLPREFVEQVRVAIVVDLVEVNQVC